MSKEDDVGMNMFSCCCIFRGYVPCMACLENHAGPTITSNHTTGMLRNQPGIHIKLRIYVLHLVGNGLSRMMQVVMWYPIVARVLDGIWVTTNMLGKIYRAQHHLQPHLSHAQQSTRMSGTMGNCYTISWMIEWHKQIPCHCYSSLKYAWGHIWHV